MREGRGAWLYTVCPCSVHLGAHYMQQACQAQASCRRQQGVLHLAAACMRLRNRIFPHLLLVLVAATPCRLRPACLIQVGPLHLAAWQSQAAGRP